ncbi:MAG TPA: acylphosphatase [Candidatus Limnocylindrales bacterium]|jgi:acylphosphatase|nr:acylphosphatase [Candidatus Limnocylindrales bacterium]
MTTARLDATVHGRVQGVGFRYYVLRVAMGSDLTGWVANAQDGSVRCVAEGARADLERLLAALEAGPAGALVDHVTTAWSVPSGTFHSFEIRSGGHPGD